MSRDPKIQGYQRHPEQRKRPVREGADESRRARISFKRYLRELEEELLEDEEYLEDNDIEEDEQ